FSGPPFKPPTARPGHILAPAGKGTEAPVIPGRRIAGKLREAVCTAACTLGVGAASRTLANVLAMEVMDSGLPSRSLSSGRASRGPVGSGPGMTDKHFRQTSRFR